MMVGGTWTASAVDLSPSLNRKYSGPMKTRVKITTTRGQHDPVDDLAAGPVQLGAGNQRPGLRAGYRPRSARPDGQQRCHGSSSLAVVPAAVTVSSQPQVRAGER